MVTESLLILRHVSWIVGFEFSISLVVIGFDIRILGILMALVLVTMLV